MTRLAGISFLAAAGLLAGCSESQQVNRTFAELSDDDIVVMVNDQPIRWNEIKEQLNFEYQKVYWQNCGKKSDANDSYYLNYRPWRMSGIVNDMINTVLFDQAAEKAGIAADGNTLSRELQDCVNQIVSWMHLQGKPSVAEVERVLPVREGLLETLIRRDVKRLNYLASQDERITNVTDKALSEARQRVAKYNAGVEATNQVQLVRLNALRGRILAGEDFCELGAKLNESGKEEEKHWDDMTWEDFNDRKLSVKLRDWAFSAKVGDVSEPILTGQGYSIFKLTRVDDGVKVGSALSLKVKRVYLSRITFAVFQKIPVTDDDSMRRRMQASYLDRMTRESIAKLRADARIYYPNGTNLWNRIPDWMAKPPVIVKTQAKK